MVCTSALVERLNASTVSPVRPATQTTLPSEATPIGSPGADTVARRPGLLTVPGQLAWGMTGYWAITTTLDEGLTAVVSTEVLSVYCVFVSVCAAGLVKP